MILEGKIHILFKSLVILVIVKLFCKIHYNYQNIQRKHFKHKRILLFYKL